MPEDLTPAEIGRGQLAEILYAENDPAKLIQRMGIYSLSYLIKQVLDAHYPEDVFGNGDIVEMIWVTNDPKGAGAFDPGVRWVALLRHALDQLPQS